MGFFSETSVNSLILCLCHRRNSNKNSGHFILGSIHYELNRSFNENSQFFWFFKKQPRFVFRLKPFKMSYVARHLLKYLKTVPLWWLPTIVSSDSLQIMLSVQGFLKGAVFSPSYCEFFLWIKRNQVTIWKKFLSFSKSLFKYAEFQSRDLLMSQVFKTSPL